MPRPEQVIHKAVFDHLRKRAAPGVFAWHTPNGAYLGGKRNSKGVAIQGAIMKGLGVVAGIPDVLALKDGVLYGLELKADGRKPTEAQLIVGQRMTAAGAVCGTAVGLDAAIAWLEERGLLRGRIAR